MSHHPPVRGRRARTVIAVTVIALLTSLLPVVPTTAANAVVHDGSTQLRAAASCWEIKQVSPSSPSGVYWLLTPALKAPQQFYCDQATDGGGWVLVGRGREGWQQHYEGNGSPQTLREVVTGPQAFRPHQLPSATVDGLLNGARVDSLTEGVRLRRATNITGTTWQEASFKFLSRDRWVWTFPAEHRVGTYRFDSVSGSGGQTNNFGTDSQFRRVDTRYYVSGIFRPQGWSFGSLVTGSNASDSYLWAENATNGSARPFTQVFLRPRLLQADLKFPAIADAGTAKLERRVLPQSGSEATVWGVTGLANGRSSELDTEAQAFTQIGNTVFVGGNFQYVQRNSSGTDRVQQSYVAGFNVNTGEWVSGFRTVLNGQVKALAALPNGLLVIGGEFTEVNGQAAVGIAALDSATGKLNTAWTVKMENRLSSGFVQVRSLSVRDNMLYIGGNFTHLAGGTLLNPTYARGGARVSVVNGTPDQNWNPAFNGSVVSIDAADDQRMYAAGYFTLSNGETATKVAAVSFAAGAPLAANWPFTGSAGDRSNYQQAIHKAGPEVWVGGSEHSVFTFNTTSFARTSGNITKQGGDFQAIELSNNTIFAGCHCGDWNYSNAFTWSNVGTGWTQADKIGFVGAWDVATRSYLPDFSPVMRGRNGLGAWGLFTDSTGTLWMAGDFVSSVRETGQNQWSGGYVRFALRDSTAPQAPSGLSVSTDTVTDTLSWTGSGIGVSYEVIRHDRVVALTTATTLSLPAAADGTRYFVRAVDSGTNRSASTPAARATAGPAPEPDPGTDQPATLVANGEQWRWRFDNSAPDAAWKTAAYNDAGWADGPAPLGFGHSSIVTTLTYEGTKPLTSYHRKTFDVVDAAAISEFTVTTRSDDGIVVYVNGKEVARRNMPTGEPTFSTYATAAPSTSTALASPLTVTVPGTALTNGKNIVAVEVHSNYRSTPNTSMDLSATATLTDPAQ